MQPLRACIYRKEGDIQNGHPKGIAIYRQSKSDPGCNTDWFEAFLDEFSRFEPKEYKIVILDNGAFHKAHRLIIPKNISLIFYRPIHQSLIRLKKFGKKSSGNSYLKLSNLWPICKMS